jgi:hypothetical protein
MPFDVNYCHVIAKESDALDGPCIMRALVDRIEYALVADCDLVSPFDSHTIYDYIISIDGERRC